MLHVVIVVNTFNRKLLGNFSLSRESNQNKTKIDCLIVASLCFIFYSTFIFIPGHIYSLILYFTVSPTIIDTPPLELNEIGS
ncbi:uncharacterized protein LOC119615243 isoform X2 [Lucilia sericata]|uniref:uncharacterized protein LOC119615243 isoform X2 n=1 Tax=Lucilia sericata TaxID=13632 RepID=UPI0018A81744|nr:uncharacterized protein LOC119615243 isoform X2 [Lucilia sericata]